MIFTEMKAWENDPAVMQVLVFATIEAKEVFDAILPTQPHTANNFPYENGIGAIYKIRAVMNSRGKFIPCVRCGVTGKEIFYLNHILCKTPEEAIIVATERLRDNIRYDLDVWIAIKSDEVEK